MCECVLSLVFWESGVNDFWMRRQGEGAWPGGMGAWPGGLGAWPGGPGGGQMETGNRLGIGIFDFFFLIYNKQISASFSSSSRLHSKGNI